MANMAHYLDNFFRKFLKEETILIISCLLYLRQQLASVSTAVLAVSFSQYRCVSSQLQSVPLCQQSASVSTVVSAFSFSQYRCVSSQFQSVSLCQQSASISTFVSAVSFSQYRCVSSQLQSLPLSWWPTAL